LFKGAEEYPKFRRIKAAYINYEVFRQRGKGVYSVTKASSWLYRTRYCVMKMWTREKQFIVDQSEKVGSGDNAFDVYIGDDWL
jgi:hypothetical protein